MSSTNDTANPGAIKAMIAVYSYFFPETRRIVHAADNLPAALFMTSTPASQAKEAMAMMDLKRPLEIPQTIDGRVDLDMIHEPIIERIIGIYKDAVPGLEGFSGRYFTSGSSQGIFHLLADFKAKGVDTIHTLLGEYEGYSAYAKTMGIRTVEVDLGNSRGNSLGNNPGNRLGNSDIDNLKKYRDGVWFISNPSARDGNILQNDIVRRLCDQGNKVVLDMAYVGSTRQESFDTSHENIRAALLSFSKPYGVFRFRMGYTFTRDPLDSLYGNKWFKDIGRLLISLKLAEDIGPSMLYLKYAPVQESIISQLNMNLNLASGAETGETGFAVRPSDVFLLGYVRGEDVLGDDMHEDPIKAAVLRPYRRGRDYRLCLTPYFEDFEKNGGKICIR